MRLKNRVQFTIVLISILNVSQAQNIIDDIESYLFSSIFDSNNSIHEFVELDEKNDTIRYWTFDESGKLEKEIDYRNNSWSASVSGLITHKSTTYKTEIAYRYNKDEQVESYLKTKNVDGKTLKTNHEFKYLTKDTIKETYKINEDGVEMHFEITRINENSNLKRTLEKMKNYIGTSYVQTNLRIEFSYDQGNRLTSQNQYFTVNSYIENEEKEIKDEVLGSSTNYKYDKRSRLTNIHEVEFDEAGVPKLRKDVNFEYKGKTERLRNIEINYGENYNPNLVKYEISYKKKW